METREAVLKITSRLKPDNPQMYYGVVLAEKTVVALIKNDPRFNIMAAGKQRYSSELFNSLDIAVLFNYLNANEELLRETSPLFEALCLPGMTETYKLHVYIHIDEETNLRTVFVCEEASEELKKELSNFTNEYLGQFRKEDILEAIDACESDMFSRISKKTLNAHLIAIDMGEVLNVLIVNSVIDQYTVYNLPVIYPEEMQPSHNRAIKEFEQLYS